MANPKQPLSPVLSDAEGEALTMACVAGAGKNGVSEENIMRFLHWANGVLADAETVRMVIDGKLVVTGFGEGDNFTFAAGPKMEVRRGR